MEKKKDKTKERIRKREPGGERRGNSTRKEGKKQRRSEEEEGRKRETGEKLSRINTKERKT